VSGRFWSGAARHSCDQCHDGGLVTLTRIVDTLWGEQQVVDAYRCGCPAGKKVSDDFRLAPQHRPALMPARKDVDG